MQIRDSSFGTDRSSSCGVFGSRRSISSKSCAESAALNGREPVSSS